MSDLCTLEQVKLYVPGYAGTDADDILTALITSESEAIHQETGREITANGDQPATRAFTITDVHARTRRVEVGDLASVGDTDITVETITADDITTTTIARATYRPLYDFGRRWQKHPWEPIVALEFPSALGATLTAGGTLLVTGNFGFPTIPTFIREACAKRAILRYASDVAAAGTQLAAAVAEVNLAGLFASSRDDIARLDRVAMGA